MSETTSPSRPPDLDARYGRSRSSSRRQRLSFRVAAIGLAVVLVGWVTWVSFGQQDSGIGTTTTQYTVVSARQTTVSWQVSAPPGTKLACSVEAQDANYGPVGWAIVQLPASSVRVRNFDTPVTTVHKASTGLISNCWTP